MSCAATCLFNLARLGEQVEQVFSRDGAPVDDITELYQPSPAGFGGQLGLQEQAS